MSAAAVPWEIDCASVKKMLDDGVPFFFLDCREKDEYALVKIPGTTLLPMSELAARGAELEPHKNEAIVVHCHHGGRSLRVAQWLRQNGYAKAQSMAGGIHQWALEIDPTLTKY